MSIDWKKMTSMDIKDLANIQIGGNSAKAPTHISEKRGINLVSHEDEELKRKRRLIITIAAAVLLVVLLYFGVVKLYANLAKESKQYKEMHEQYEQAQEELKDFDRVQLEYRSYSMDWMDSNDESGRYVSVSRLTLLDMLEEKIMPYCSVTGLNIDGDTMRVNITGTNLQQLSAICAEVEKLPFVASASLQTASMDETSGTVKFEVRIELQRPDTKEGE